MGASHVLDVGYFPIFTNASDEIHHRAVCFVPTYKFLKDGKCKYIEEGSELDDISTPYECSNQSRSIGECEYFVHNEAEGKCSCCDFHRKPSKMSDLDLTATGYKTYRLLIVDVPRLPDLHQWKKVRHVPSTGNWHPARDNLSGTEEYGVSNDDT